MNINISVEGMTDLINAIEKVERGTLDLRQLGVWKAVEREFYAIQTEIFDSANYGQWEPLSEHYRIAKDRKYGGPTRTLIAEGDMYKEFTDRAKDVHMEDQSISFSFSQPAGYHMSKEPRSKMPYRSSLDLKEEHRLRLFGPIGKRLKQLIDNAKLKDIRGF